MALIGNIQSPAARRWHDAAYWAVLLGACAVFMAMNVLTTFKEDDMAFSLIEGEWTPARSLLDVLCSHGNLYLHANGRTANLVAAVYCALLGKGAFDVCNTLVFGLMAHLLSLLSTGRRSLLSLSMFLVAVGTCYPVPGETMLWLDGSCNYMWAITLSLALVLYLSRTHRRQLGWGGAVLLLMAAVVAGSFNEATSWGVLPGLAVYYALNRSSWDRRAATALLGYLLGVALIVASPGAWARAAEGDIAVNMSLADLLHSRCYIFGEKMWRFYLPVAAALVGLAALVMGRARTVRQCPWTWVFLCLALVMFLLGQTTERAYAPLFTVALLILTMAADRVSRHWPWVRLAAVVLCLGLAGYTAARGVGELRRYRAYDNQAMAEVRSAPAQAILLERQYDGYSRFIKPMNFTSTHFFAHEDIYRGYFGKRNVQFVSDSVYVRYHESRLLDGATVSVPRPGSSSLFKRVYTLDNQDYIAIELATADMPSSFQTAELRPAGNGASSAREQQRRRDYGITIDYDPAGFYPIDYQGRVYLICGAPGPAVRSVTFPLAFSAHPQQDHVLLY